MGPETMKEAGGLRGPSRAEYLALVATGLACGAFLAFLSPSAWNIDFNEFYAAGKLVGTGHLYDWNAIRPLELQRGTTVVPFGRIPAWAFVFQPLSAMPYAAARTAWLGIGIAALAGFVLLWPLARREPMIAAICWSLPVLMGLLFGQDSVLLLLFIAAGIRLLEKRGFWAGVLFSGCVAKPHLALLIPLLLAARGKWNAVCGGAAGVAASLLISFAVEGSNWPVRWLALARAPEFDPAADRMPTLKGMVAVMGGGLAAQIAGVVAVVAACWFLGSRLPLPSAAALTLAAGLLVSPHAYGYDAVLLLPAAVLSLAAPKPAWFRAWALLLLTPIPYVFLLTNIEWPGHLMVTGFTLTLLAVEVIGSIRKKTISALIA